jgi:hypothetical protein
MQLSRRDSIILIGLWAAVFVAGCSGSKPYQNTPDNNLRVYTAAESGSWFSSVRAAVDIHRLTADCRTEYEGTVQLNRATIDVGIPPTRWSQLVFVFSSSSFLANRSGSMTHETLLKPRPGYQYHIHVTYRDDMYNVVVRETHPSRSVARDIEHKDVRACHAKSIDESRVSSNTSTR